MAKKVWVFPGQGSQGVGMGADLASLPEAQLKFKQAEAILGWSVWEKWGGDEAELARTRYTQPCLYAMETLLADLLLARGQLPDAVAGHSLGEYSALYAVRVFDFETGLRLVKYRAELMDGAAGGKMAALMKFDRQRLDRALAATPGATLANDNSQDQVVISGTPEAVDAVLSQVKAKRAVPLKVSGAFHSPLMAAAAQQFQTALAAVTFEDAKAPVLSNVDPTPTTRGPELKERLIRQMTGPVRWREIMARLPELGVSEAIEVGPGKVLTGLLKRACPEMVLRTAGSFADLSALT